MIDICYVGSGVNIIITPSPIGHLSWCHLCNFPLVNFVPNKYDKSFKWQPGKKIKDS